MTTRIRIDLLTRAYPRRFPRRALEDLLRAQLGRVDALDRWSLQGVHLTKAQAPRMIYHICAGNLAVSAFTSLMHGLLLGARNVMKLPGAREESETRDEILDFVAGLPAALRKLVETQETFNTETLAAADVIVAFGSDATMEKIRGQVRWTQKFFGHGHAVSLLWLQNPDEMTPRQWQACAVDVLTYDQLGCLSPQAVYFPPGVEAERLGPRLGAALEKMWNAQPTKPARGLAVSARIEEARDLAFARGHRVWLPPKKHSGWTIIHDPDPVFKASPLHGVIHLRQVGEDSLPRALAPVAGRISTVGTVGKRSSRLQERFLSLGVTRFCEAGRMQFPPLTWHHDGRAALGELVTWIDA